MSAHDILTALGLTGHPPRQGDPSPEDRRPPHLPEGAHRVAVTLKPADLIRVLSNAALFAGKDDALPVLTCVHLRAADGLVQTAATDRYMLGTDKADAEVTDPLSVLLRTADVAQIIRMIKPSARYDWARVDIDAETSLSVDMPVESPHEVVTRLTFADGASGATCSVVPYDGVFPKTETLLPDDRFTGDAGKGITEVTLDARYLAVFGKVIVGTGDKAMRMRWSTRPHADKPNALRAGLTRVDLGPTFVGGIMPIARDYPE